MTAAEEDVVSAEPVKVQVTRWRCPFCGRSHSGRGRARDHIGRCWRNPAVRSCKTCVNFDPGSNGCGTPDCNCASGESCFKGLPVEVPRENRPDRTTFPISCPLWEFLDEDEDAIATGGGVTW